jgi:hypothetical protein
MNVEYTAWQCCYVTKTEGSLQPTFWKKRPYESTCTHRNVVINNHCDHNVLQTQVTLFDKLIVVRMVKKYLAFYGTRMFITVFTGPATGPCSGPTKPNLKPTPYFFKMNSVIIAWARWHLFLVTVHETITLLGDIRNVQFFFFPPILSFYFIYSLFVSFSLPAQLLNLSHNFTFLFTQHSWGQRHIPTKRFTFNRDFLFYSFMRPEYQYNSFSVSDKYSCTRSMTSW